MSEFPERLWPEIDEQPGCEITYEGETYHLCWQNTQVQRYRTGNEDIDLQLSKHDHILHRFAKREEDDAGNIIFEYIILPFDRLDPEILQFLAENHYPDYTDPIVDRYYREHMEQQPDSSSIPDAIGPEFGASAA